MSSARTDFKTLLADGPAVAPRRSLASEAADALRHAVVAGALAGGGLTVIANAPNPAGMSILRKYFADESVSAGGLFAAALLPTLVAAAAFRLL